MNSSRFLNLMQLRSPSLWLTCRSGALNVIKENASGRPNDRKSHAVFIEPLQKDLTISIRIDNAISRNKEV